MENNYDKKRYLYVPLLCGYSFGYGHDGNAEYHDLVGKLNRFIHCDAFKPLEKHEKYNLLAKKLAAIK